MATRKFKGFGYVSIISLTDKNEYIDFINDCKEKKYDSSAQLCVHHIVPVHDGGQDTDENRVILDFDDHVKAHYLIAKVYQQKADILISQLMSGMEKNVYTTVRKIGAKKTHKLLEEKKKTFGIQYFKKKCQIELLKKTFKIEARSRGGKIGGKKRWKEFLIKPEDKYLFFYQKEQNSLSKPTVCIFNCSDATEVLNELQKIHSNPSFRRASPLISGARKKAYGWSCEKINTN